MAGWQHEAYLAGIFDGEGYVLCAVYGEKTRQPGWTQVRAGVSMTDRAPLLLFQARFGGSVTRRTRDATRKEIFCWVVSGRKAVPFLEFVASNCVIKSAQAAVALEVIGLLLPGGARNTRSVSPENKNKRMELASHIVSLRGIPVNELPEGAKN